MMGTDIHGIFQKRENGKWVDVPTKYKFNRHYLLFAWLNDVRNGFGFAGVPTHTAIKPLAAGRGFPEDFEAVDECHPVVSKEFLPEYAQKYYEEDKTLWMGDHSFSWLSGEEILAGDRPRILRTGVVTKEFFLQWDGKSQPDHWSGGISGKGIVVSIPSEVGPLTTHVQIEWFEETKESLAYFVDEVKRLKDLHGEVRFVFGFDS